MSPLPHDAADLYLAPVALGIDARLQELGQLTPDDLAVRIALAGDRPSSTYSDRKDGLLSAATELIDMHGWTADLVDRGLLIQHAGRSLVLGLPAHLRDYLTGSRTDQAD